METREPGGSRAFVAMWSPPSDTFVMYPSVSGFSEPGSGFSVSGFRDVCR